MIRPYYIPRKYYKSRKYHGKCEKCGCECKDPRQYVDESNYAISWHSPYLCEKCYSEQHPEERFKFFPQLNKEE